VPVILWFTITRKQLMETFQPILSRVATVNEGQRLTKELLLSLRTPIDCALDPAAIRVAFGLRGAASECGPILPSKIWVAAEGAAPIQVTTGNGCDRLPQWSPDGGRLAFASDRATTGMFALFVAEPEPSSAASPLGDVPGSIEHIEWSPDSSTILVLAADAGSYGGDADVTISGPGGEDDPRVSRPATAFRRLFLIDVATGSTREVGPKGLTVWEVSWCGGDEAVAVTSTDPTGSGWYHTTIAVLDFPNRSARHIYKPRWTIEGVRLSPDRSRAAVVEGFSSDAGLLAGSIKVIDLATGAAHDPSPGLESVSTIDWVDSERLWYVGWNDTGTAIGEVHLVDGLDAVWADEVMIGDSVKPGMAVGLGADGLTVIVAATRQAHGEPPEIAVFDPRGSRTWKQLTAFNEHLTHGLALPVREKIRWQSRDGLEISGLLFHPLTTNSPGALVVAIHGGPTWCWNSCFELDDSNALMLASSGYAVLLPNPRGSNGRTNAFAEAVIGDPGGADLEDILTGIELCIERGIAHPDRIGIAGLSYGGFMSAWAPTQTDRFRAAVAVSCVSDWVSHHNTTSIGGFDTSFLVGDWRDDNGPHRRLSPIMHSHKSTTPTLVIHGELDTCTPVGQAEELYAALAEAGVETELVIYPREGHVPAEYRHQLDYLQRKLAWFDRHLNP